MSILIAMLELFFVFLKIGLFTFGGGYAMIPLLSEELVSRGYFTLEQLNYLIGIGEATPGPFSINIAGLSGFFAFSSEHFLIQLSASVIATIGVVLPSFIIILIFSIFSYKIITTKPYKDAFKVIRPMILGFIFAAFLSIATKVIFGDFMVKVSLDFIAAVIFFVVTAIALLFKKLSPIALVGISAFLGIILYGLL